MYIARASVQRLNLYVCVSCPACFCLNPTQTLDCNRHAQCGLSMIVIQYNTIQYKVHIRPVLELEYAAVVWNSGYVQDNKQEAQIGPEAMDASRTRIREPIFSHRAENKDYGDRLKALGLYSVEGQLLRADLTKCWKICPGHCSITRSALWDMNTQYRYQNPWTSVYNQHQQVRN